MLGSIDGAYRFGLFWKHVRGVGLGIVKQRQRKSEGIPMAMTKKKIFASLLTAVLISMVGPAYAGLIYDLEVVELDGFTGKGSIEFTASSGNDRSGVKAFDFSGTGPIGNVSFTGVNDIENVTWSITGMALELNLGTVLDQTLLPGPISSCILLRNVNATGTCGGGLISVIGGDFSAVRQQRISQTILGTGTLTTMAKAAVPEPSILVLMAIGLAGAGFTRRRKLAA